MDFFLQKVVKNILSKHEAYLDKTCFIVPNKRTALFLKKYLAEEKKTSLLLPDFYTIEEFAQKVSGLQKADSLTLLGDLFNVYKVCLQKEQSVAFPIDEFMSWGGMLLNDFADVDTAMADPQKVFGYLSEAKAISLWNLNKELTDLQKKYLRFYNSLYNIYTTFSKHLLSKGYAYQAHILRYLLQNTNLLDEITKSKAHFFFIGFNALTALEEKLFDHFFKLKKVTIYFDYDLHFIEKSGLEAGVFIKRNINKYGQSPFHSENTSYTQKKKKVHIIGVPQNVGQAKIAGLVLQRNFSEAIEKTAMVLPKEELLFPVLNALPDKVEHVNVTMGYPLQHSLMYDLFMSVINLYDNAHRISRLREADILRLHIKDFLYIIENPYFKQTYLHIADSGIPAFVKYLKSNNKVLYSSSELLTLIKDFAVKDLPAWDSIKEMAACKAVASLEMIDLLKQLLNNLLDSISDTDSHNKAPLELEFLYHYSKMLNRMQPFFENVEGATLNTLKTLHKTLIKNISIPFSGEPLKGLQIMGLLESRNLDFENLIILSCNEGVLPHSKSTNSFIPFDIRRQFKMSVYSDDEAVYAYHFYRLLQRAQNVYILYNTEHDEFGKGGEKSRYVTQIENEWPIANPLLSLNKSIISASVVGDFEAAKISISKTKDIISLLQHKAKKGFSPSSLAVFLQCSLRFYFQYVLGLKPEEEPEENADAAILGSAVHDVLENIYKPLTGETLTPQKIDIKPEILEKELRQSFVRLMGNADMSQGKNHLLLKIAIKYIVNFLNYEKQYLSYLSNKGESLRVVGTEMSLQKTFSKALFPDCEVAVVGKVDRIDSIGNTIRIIDYKTGLIEKKELKLEKWEGLDENQITPKVLQLLLYGYLYSSKNTEGATIQPGFISLRNPGEGLAYLDLPEDESLYTKDVHQKTEELLATIFKHIFASDIPFRQTENSDNCKYCDFKNICNR